MIDHRSYTLHFTSWEIKAWKKNLGLNGIALKAHADWFVKLRISCAIYLQATWEKMASRFASVTSEEMIQINFFVAYIISLF